MYSVNGEYGHWKKDNVSEKGKQTEDETTYIFVPGSKNPIIAWYAYKERIPPDKPKGFMMKKICKLQMQNGISHLQNYINRCVEKCK